MQVSHSEGLANHTGPESCVGIREDAGEALTGERIGQPSSDMLNQFVTHTGGGLFACPGGMAEGRFIGQRLFEAG